MSMLTSFTRALATSSLQSDARRAALLLHALSAADQNWVLDNMATPQRMLLSSLLDELRQLGLPADQSLVDEAIRAAPANASGARVGQPSTADLEQADASVLAGVLASEPPALIARLLRLRAWRWSDALLSQLGPMQQVRVREILADVKLDPSRPTTRLDMQLVERLQQRLALLARSDAAPFCTGTGTGTGTGTRAARESSRSGSPWLGVLRRRLA